MMAISIEAPKQNNSWKTQLNTEDWVQLGIIQSCPNSVQEALL